MAKLTRSQKATKSRVAEKLKGKKGIKNPFAVATAVAKRAKRGSGRKR